jgi:putative peptide zinc metalloprotease protein
LEKGTAIAELAYHDHLSQVKIHSARMSEQQSIIDELKARPRPEEIELAQQRVEVAMIRAEFSKGEYERERRLLEKHAASIDDVEQARRQYEVEVAKVEEAKADLELMQAGAPPDEILAAEAKYERWREERDSYQSKIDRSILRMPFDGQLVTLLLKQKQGRFLETGETFATVEDNSKVLAEIELPEAAVAFIEESAPIRLRSWAYEDHTFSGTVTEIDSNVILKPFGRVVKVMTLLDNDAGRLKAGMTGNAKIRAESTPVWKVFSRAISRFVWVEVWSWIP